MKTDLCLLPRIILVLGLIFSHPRPVTSRAVSDVTTLTAAPSFMETSGGWLPIPPIPDGLGRQGHSAVWTGSEMILWGGEIGSGGPTVKTGYRYNPSTAAWLPVSSLGAPAARRFHSAVWTGTRMIVWGGEGSNSGPTYNTGGIYDPGTDSWKPLSTVNAPKGRYLHVSVWSGTEMIIWGGDAVSEGITALDDGARYNPVTDTWAPMSQVDAPSPRTQAVAIWAEDGANSAGEMIVFGGAEDYQCYCNGLNTGARYNPSSDSWQTLPTSNAPLGLLGERAVWSTTTEEMIVWGGMTLEGVPTNTGSSYNRVTNQWTQIPLLNAPSPIAFGTAVWTGSSMLVWGGLGQNNMTLSTGGFYHPEERRWSAASNLGSPISRFNASAIWTGSTMILWGGLGEYGYERLNSGGTFNPSLDYSKYDCTIQKDLPVEECEVLVTLYLSTSAAGWTTSTGWLVTTEPCSWYGVLCEAGHVWGIILADNRLFGTLPSQLGNLPFLEILDVSVNSLSGGIPSELGKLSQLTDLNLNINWFTGEIPAELGKLSQLEHLSLDENKLTGAIPASLGELTYLKYLFLRRNQLEGGIPHELGLLSNLTYLDLSENKLTGTLPSTIGGLLKLTDLRLNNNLLSGGFPASITNLRLWSIYYNNTNICEPTNQAFQDWLSSIAWKSRTYKPCKDIPLVLLPGIMGSRLYNYASNEKCFWTKYIRYGEVWLPQFNISNLVQNYLKLETLILEEDLEKGLLEPTDDCYNIVPFGIMETYGDINFYGEFIDVFSGYGYIVETFPYDWRLSLVDNAKLLNYRIQDWGYQKVILIGHSMGGMLARTYIEDETRAEKVERVISVGSPYWGAPETALRMRGGFLPGDFHIGPVYLAPPVVSDILRNSPGTMELLPSENYFRDTSSYMYYMHNGISLSTFQSTLDFFAETENDRGKQNRKLMENARDYHRIYDDFREVKTKYDILAVKHLPTKQVIDEVSWGNWFKKGTYFQTYEIVYGDGTVPIGSATIPGMAGTSTHVTIFDRSCGVTHAHGELMNDPIILQAIDALLKNLPVQTCSVPSSTNGEDGYFQVHLLGETEVTITDSHGNVMTVDPMGKVSNTIPGSTYEPKGTQTEAFLPRGQSYNIMIHPLSEEPFQLKVIELESIDPQNPDRYFPNQMATFVDIPAFSGSRAEVVIGGTSGMDALILALDNNNDQIPDQTLPPNAVVRWPEAGDVTMPVTKIDIEGIQAGSGYYTGTVTITLSSSDSGSGVLKTEISLDRGKTWQAYQVPLQVTAENTPLIVARSVDRAGNIEYPWPSYRLRPITFYIPFLIR